MRPWEMDPDWWREENCFTSFIVGGNYRFLESRVVDCLLVRKMMGLAPLLDTNYKQFQKKFRKCVFLGVSSDCDWLPDEMLVEGDIEVKEVNLGVFVGMPEKEKNYYLFFAEQAEDDNGFPLFEDDLS